jgi:WD40 repeat protein
VEPEPQPIWGCLVDERDTDYHYIAFSPDSATLAVSVGRSVRLIDVATGETIRSFGHEAREGFWYIAFSPDGAILATGGTDSTIQLWDMMTGEILTSLDDHTDWVDWIAFNSDGTLLASFGRDNTIRLWGISSPISGQNGLTP